MQSLAVTGKPGCQRSGLQSRSGLCSCITQPARCLLRVTHVGHTTCPCMPFTHTCVPEQWECHHMHHGPMAVAALGQPCTTVAAPVQSHTTALDQSEQDPSVLSTHSSSSKTYTGFRMKDQSKGPACSNGIRRLTLDKCYLYKLKSTCFGCCRCSNSAFNLWTIIIFCQLSMCMCWGEGEGMRSFGVQDANGRRPCITVLLC